MLLIDRTLASVSELQYSRQSAGNGLTSSGLVTSSGHVTFCSDSIERYFRSLRQAATVDESLATGVDTSDGRGADDGGDDGDDCSYAAAVKQSFRARVDAVKCCLLQSADNNTHVTSEVKGHNLEPGVNVEVREVAVRDSENFEYEDSDERRLAAVTGLSEALRQQLRVDLDESINSHTQTDNAPVMTSRDMTSQHGRPTSVSVKPSSCEMIDTLTFDYVDLAASDNALPEDLRQELRLDLRDSTDDQTTATDHDHLPLPVLKESETSRRDYDDDDDNVINGEDLSRNVNNRNSNNTDDDSCTTDKKSFHQQTLPCRLQSSAMCRKLGLPGARSDVLKPVPSNARPQTAAAAAAASDGDDDAVGSGGVGCVTASKKKTVAWSRDTTHVSTVTHSHKSTLTSSTSKPGRPASARASAGRHLVSASANQHRASSSADERNSTHR